MHSLYIFIYFFGLAKGKLLILWLCLYNSYGICRHTVKWTSEWLNQNTKTKQTIKLELNQSWAHFCCTSFKRNDWCIGKKIKAKYNIQQSTELRLLMNVWAIFDECGLPLKKIQKKNNYISTAVKELVKNRFLLTFILFFCSVFVSLCESCE